MSVRYRELLKDIRTFPSLIKYLRDELDWPIHTQDFEELTFDYTAEELGIDSRNAAKIQEIKRLRPLSANQPWGIFFVKFEPKRLPVVALRRILSRVVVKKRASANSAERAAWEAEDLLFVSNYGEGEERKISLAHFTQDRAKNDLPTLKVLGWDNLDTALHLDHVAEELYEKLAWPEDENNIDDWRHTWRSAFTLRHREVITTSKSLAMTLAELARDLRNRIKTVLSIETEKGPLIKLKKAFREFLIHDLDDDDFADMYAQTITYGLLSARIMNPKAKATSGFAAHTSITNPFLKELLETFLDAGGQEWKKENGMSIDFDELGVSEVVDLLDDPKTNMEAVVRDFGDRNPQDDPVIHFYELFLKEYNAKKRMQRGVFYTPLQVVSYIVRSIDEVLRTEFNLEDGLADTTTWGEMAEIHNNLQIPNNAKPEDPFIVVLDPATGTGTFLVEVIDLIYKTLSKKWKNLGYEESEIEKLWNDYVPKHLLPRIYGYELLMAPYAISHMKIGLKLYETGYRFGNKERARIYLTNSLEPAQDFTDRLSFAIPVLAHEAEAVNEIKRNQHFTIVIGNPPYAGHSANKGEWISRLVKDYYFVDGKPLGEKNPKWLQDDYVKFIRFGQKCISMTGTGIHSYITNHGYIDNPTFRGMRQSLCKQYNRIQILDLHGNAKKRETAPDGSIDKNVFDIQQGVAIFLACRNTRDVGFAEVTHSHLYGKRDTKYTFLEENSLSTTSSENIKAVPPLYLFLPMDSGRSAEYNKAIAVTDVMPVYSPGVVTGQDANTIAFTREEAEELCRRKSLPLTVVRKILYRSLDFRFIVYDDKVVTRRRFEVMRHVLEGQNLGLITVRRAPPQSKCNYFLVSHMLVSNGAIRSDNQSIDTFFPLWLSPTEESDLISSSAKPNISPHFLDEIRIRLTSFGVTHKQTKKCMSPDLIFQYMYAVFYSPQYREAYFTADSKERRTNCEKTQK